MWLEIAVPKSRSFLDGNFYGTDRTSPYYDKDFMVKLNGILDTASSEGKEMLLFGDFSRCFMSSHWNDCGCKQLKSLFRSLNIKQLIDQPTRMTKTSKSLIVLVAINCPQNVCESGLVSTHLSDHELVYCVRNYNGKEHPLKSRPSEIMRILMLTPFVKTWKVLTGILILVPMDLSLLINSGMTLSGNLSLLLIIMHRWCSAACAALTIVLG